MDLGVAFCTQRERQVDEDTVNRKAVAILVQAISCSNVHGVFPVHERFWFCLFSFSFVLMARASDGTDVPVSPMRASSSNMESLDGSPLTLKEQDFVPVQWRMKSTTCIYSCRSS